MINPRLLTRLLTLLLAGLLLAAAGCQREDEVEITKAIDFTSDGRIGQVDTINPDALPAGSVKVEEIDLRTGKLVAKGWKCDLKTVGPWVYYHPNGVPSQVGTYRWGEKRHGEWRSYYPSGHLHTVETFSYGQRHGPYVDYYDNGQKWNAGRYYEGQRTGLWKSWYDNGRRMNVGGYLNGRPFGLWRHWSEDGSLVNNTNYQQPGEMAQR